MKIVKKIKPNKPILPNKDYEILLRSKRFLDTKLIKANKIIAI